LDYLATLAQTRLIWLEYGLQSAHDATLALINRGHDVATFSDAVARTRKRDLPVCVHVILGLPGETHDDILATARFLADQDIQGVKIHVLYVIRGTVLEQWYREGRYQCLSREEYVALVGDFLSLLPDSVIIQRLTGDPHPEELVVPKWALEKQTNLVAIDDYLEKQDLFQGKFWERVSGGVEGPSESRFPSRQP
jgi:hypothetical protein